LLYGGHARFSQDGTITRDRWRRFALDQSDEWRDKEVKRGPQGSAILLILRKAMLLRNLYAEDI
jgi:hypothetical protein